MAKKFNILGPKSGRTSANVDSAMAQIRADKRHAESLLLQDRQQKAQNAIKMQQIRQSAINSMRTAAQRAGLAQQARADKFNLAKFQHGLGMQKQGEAFKNNILAAEHNAQLAYRGKGLSHRYRMIEQMQREQFADYIKGKYPTAASIAGGAMLKISPPGAGLPGASPVWGSAPPAVPPAGGIGINQTGMGGIGMGGIGINQTGMGGIGINQTGINQTGVGGIGMGGIGMGGIVATGVGMGGGVPMGGGMPMGGGGQFGYGYAGAPTIQAPAQQPVMPAFPGSNTAVPATAGPGGVPIPSQLQTQTLQQAMQGSFDETLSGFASAQNYIKEMRPGSGDTLHEINQEIGSLRSEAGAKLAKEDPARYLERQTKIMDRISDFKQEIDDFRQNSLARNNPYQEGWRERNLDLNGYGRNQHQTGYRHPASPEGGAGSGIARPFDQWTDTIGGAYTGNWPGETSEGQQRTMDDRSFQTEWNRLKNIRMTPKGEKMKHDIGEKIESLKKGLAHEGLGLDEFYQERRKLAKEVSAIEWNDYVMPDAYEMDGPAVYRNGPNGREFVGMDTNATQDEINQHLEKTMIPEKHPDFGVLGWRKINSDGSVDYIKAEGAKFNMDRQIKAMELAQKTRDHQEQMRAMRDRDFASIESKERINLRQGILSDHKADREKAMNFGSEVTIDPEGKRTVKYNLPGYEREGGPWNTKPDDKAAPAGMSAYSPPASMKFGTYGKYGDGTSFGDYQADPNFRGGYAAGGLGPFATKEAIAARKDRNAGIPTPAPGLHSPGSKAVSQPTSGIEGVSSEELNNAITYDPVKHKNYKFKIGSILKVDSPNGSVYYRLGEDGVLTKVFEATLDWAPYNTGSPTRSKGRSTGRRAGQSFSGGFGI